MVACPSKAVVPDPDPDRTEWERLVETDRTAFVLAAAAAVDLPERFDAPDPDPDRLSLDRLDLDRLDLDRLMLWLPPRMGKRSRDKKDMGLLEQRQWASAAKACNCSITPDEVELPPNCYPRKFRSVKCTGIFCHEHVYNVRTFSKSNTVCGHESDDDQVPDGWRIDYFSVIAACSCKGPTQDEIIAV